MASGARRRELQGGGGMRGGGAGNAQITQTLATVSVTDTGLSATTIDTFSVARPCYLVDLTSQAASSTVSFALGPAPQINGVSYSTKDTYEASFAVGSVHQLDLTGINAHPFHLHINSFQLAANPADTVNGYFMAGDWHDTILMASNAVSVKFQADRYVGKQVIHCHILEHEDGMS